MDARQQRRMFGLNYTQVALGILIAGGTAVSGVATFVTMPARVEAVQTGQKAIWEHINQTDTRRDVDHEILVRLEEQTKAIREDQSEIKSDLKTLKRP